jgi:O-antigen/teichoic acid export membrane protein
MYDIYAGSESLSNIQAELGSKILKTFDSDIAYSLVFPGEWYNNLIPILSLVVIPRTISIMITSSFLGQENSKYVVIGNIITFGVLVTSIFPLAELFEITGVAIAYVIGFSSNTVYMGIKYLQLRNKNQ